MAGAINNVPAFVDAGAHFVNLYSAWRWTRRDELQGAPHARGCFCAGENPDDVTRGSAFLGQAKTRPWRHQASVSPQKGQSKILRDWGRSATEGRGRRLANEAALLDEEFSPQRSRDLIKS